MQGGTVFLGTDFFKDQPVVSVTNATLGFFHNTGDTGGAADNLSLGHTSLVAGLGTGDVGKTTVFLDASGTTTINFGNISAGTFVIGATDATDIFAGLTSGLFMDLPGTNTGQFTFFSADFNTTSCKVPLGRSQRTSMAIWLLTTCGAGLSATTNWLVGSCSLL